MFELGLSKLASMPTVLNNMHESLFRSYHALRKIKELLAKGTPGDVVLAIISEIDNLQPLQIELVANKVRSGRDAADALESKEEWASRQ